MDEQHNPWFGIRDALWLGVIVLALVVWAWDRKKLADQVEKLGPATTTATTETTGPVTVPPTESTQAVELPPLVEPQ